MRLVVAVTIAIGALGLAGAAIAAAAANSMTLIVSRDHEALEVFVALPADQVSALFNVSGTVLTGGGPQVDFERFQDGTWEFGEAMLANLVTKTADLAVEFEAVSVMLHPSADNFPFNDPLDAIVAVSVCSVFDRQAVFRLEHLNAYAAFFLENNETKSPVSIAFPRTRRFPLLIRTRVFEDGRFIGSKWQVLTDGGTLVIS